MPRLNSAPFDADAKALVNLRCGCARQLVCLPKPGCPDSTCWKVARTRRPIPPLEAPRVFFTLHAPQDPLRVNDNDLMIPSLCNGELDLIINYLLATSPTNS